MNTNKNISKQSKEKGTYWQDHILSCKQSGLSQKQYCINHKLALSTFTYWKRKLGKNQQQPACFYPLTVQSDTFLEEQNRNPGLRLLLSDTKYQIELEDNFSSTSLKKLLHVLEEA